MRSNCCCDSHSTTRRASCKKGSISSVARTQACSPPLLLLLLWDIAAFSRVGPMASSFCKVHRFAVHTKTGGLSFQIFPSWGAIQMRTLFCENAHVLHCSGRPPTRILKTQCLKTHFFENGSQGGEIRKRSPPIFMWMANPHTFQNDDAIAPSRNLLSLTSEPCNVP